MPHSRGPSGLRLPAPPRSLPALAARHPPAARAGGLVPGHQPASRGRPGVRPRPGRLVGRPRARSPAQRMAYPRLGGRRAAPCHSPARTRPAGWKMDGAGRGGLEQDRDKAWPSFLPASSNCHPNATSLSRGAGAPGQGVATLPEAPGRRGLAGLARRCGALRILQVLQAGRQAGVGLWSTLWQLIAHAASPPPLPDLRAPWGTHAPNHDACSSHARDYHPHHD